MSAAFHKLKSGGAGPELAFGRGGTSGQVSVHGAFPPPQRGSRIYDSDVRLKEVRAARIKRRRKMAEGVYKARTWKAHASAHSNSN